jgi:hypothetical protein
LKSLCPVPTSNYSKVSTDSHLFSPYFWS